MAKGVIVRFLSDKGFGFIKDEATGKEIWFHKSSVRGNKTPQPGMVVEFEPGIHRGNERAENVRIVSGPPCGVVFDTFLRNEDGKKVIKHEIYFDAARETAEIWKKDNFKSTQFRRLYDALRNLVIAPLKKIGKGSKSISMEEARARFGKFYAQYVVRQNNRKVVPDSTLEFFEKHKDLVLSSKDELTAFFEYITAILCYFPDK